MKIRIAARLYASFLKRRIDGFAVRELYNRRDFFFPREDAAQSLQSRPVFYLQGENYLYRGGFHVPKRMLGQSMSRIFELVMIVRF